MQGFTGWGGGRFSVHAAGVGLLPPFFLQCTPPGIHSSCTSHPILTRLPAFTPFPVSARQHAFPTPSSPVHGALHALLGADNEAATARAVELMARGDAAGLGALMTAAQAAFDAAAGPLCPSQLGAVGSPVLHRVLALPDIQPLILGGKGVGSQGDGTAQLLCRDPAAQHAVASLLKQQLGLDSLVFTVPAA